MSGENLTVTIFQHTGMATEALVEDVDGWWKVSLRRRPYGFESCTCGLHASTFPCRHVLAVLQKLAIRHRMGASR